MPGQLMHAVQLRIAQIKWRPDPTFSLRVYTPIL